MDKDTVANILNEIAFFLELKGENPFKSRSYNNAARTVQTFGGDLKALVKENRLDELPGIGKAIQEKINELVNTGQLRYYEDLKASFPPGLREMAKLPRMGARRIKLLYEELGIDSIETLEKACLENHVSKIRTLGPKMQQNMLDAIAQRRQHSQFHLYGDVIALAEGLYNELRSHPSVIRVAIAGSYRRGKEVLKDLDLLASSANPIMVMDYFITLPGVQQVVNHGETKSTVLLANGLQCDLRVVSDEQFPYALHHFTGSKEHNVAMRQRAINRGMKMSEWGLFNVSNESTNVTETLTPCSSEEEIFSKLGLDYIPPELRENLGEIQAAEQHQLPKLVEWSDIRGTFHNHTIYSDGLNTLEEMAEAAREMGLEYCGIADHSKSSFQASGLKEDRLLAQVSHIQKLNSQWSDFQIFAGSEVDILKDGSLDYDNSILAQLDYVVASIHNSFFIDEENMTNRIIKAIENEYVTMLGHLTGRLLLERQGYEINTKKIIEACAANDTWIELNANPKRLDMDWRWWKFARDIGVKCVINPDAHRVSHLGFLRIGVNIARKGWLRKQDVINTFALSEIRSILNGIPVGS